MSPVLECPFCGQVVSAPERLGEDHWAIWCPCCEYYGPRGQSERLAEMAFACRPEANLDAIVNLIE